MSRTESLTAYRMGQLNKARDEHGFRNVQAHDGKIYSRKMVATVKNYLWLSGANFTLYYGKEKAFCVHCIFLLRFG